MKIVINRCSGGFSLTDAVYDELGITWDGYGFLRNELLGIESENKYAYRADKRLIEAIEKIGIEKASGAFSNLKIIEIPDGVAWEIDEYGGMESVHEKHKVWGNEE